jgi:hypothetical protein
MLLAQALHTIQGLLLPQQAKQGIASRRCRLRVERQQLGRRRKFCHRRSYPLGSVRLQALHHGLLETQQGIRRRCFPKGVQRTLCPLLARRPRSWRQRRQVEHWQQLRQAPPLQQAGQQPAATHSS